MKKSLVLILIILSSFQVLHSQDWFSTDNNWVYRSYGFEFSGYAEANIIGDTMINNIPSKILNFAYSEGNPLVQGIMNYEIQHIVYEKNDSVFYLNFLDEFKLMYDFTMVPGDSLIVYGDIKGITCDDPTIYFLDSTSLITSSTDTFRVQHMTVTDVALNDTFSRDIIEFIGSAEGSFILQNNLFCIFDAAVLQLCSFENNVSSFQFLEDVDCYQVTTSSKQTLINNSIKVYPNPSTGFYLIDAEEIPVKLEVIDLKGQTVGSFYKTKQLDISNLESGSYFLKIWSRKDYHVEKIMVH